MKIRALCLLLAGVAILMTCTNPGLQPPAAEIVPHELEAHGEVRVDDYYWLRDRDNPKVIAYLEAENAYMDAVMADTATLQQTLFDEIKGRIRQTDSSAPVLDHGYRYYHRTEDGLEYPIYCRVEDRPGAAEEVLLDVNAVAEGHDFCSAGEIEVSPESDTMVWAVDTVGRRKYELRFKDLATGRALADRITEVTGSSAWANDGRTLFYTRQDPETLRSFQVWRHVLGSDPADDTLVYQEDDETFSVYMRKTASDRFILLESTHTLMTEVRFIDADAPLSEPVVIAPRQRGVEYTVAHHGDRFLILTNLDAENFRLMDAPVSSPGRENWREVIAHRNDVLLQGVRPFRDHIVLSERTGGLNRLVVVAVDDGVRREIEFDETAYDVWVDDNREFDTGTLRFGYTSLTTPVSIYDYTMSTGERELVKQDEVLGGYDPSAYVSERVMAPARDGVEIPVSILRRTDLPMDGSAPLLLHAYGSYGSSSDPDFDPGVISLLDRGFSYAIAHVRGGQEMGRRWYEDGKLLNKKNTFTDFIDCARVLVERGYTSPSGLVARGRSAGGLLMGAVANMEPELFAAIVAHVPFVDVITTMLDESIPLTTNEFDEWGNPEDPEFYDYMLSYSPYDQVEAKDYPAMMVTAGLHDSQVQYWEPAKWVAKLRALKTGDNLLVFRTRMD
ncbi:MAG: S9 family peptidase, partial [Candidatus Sulfomarinibacteraceae bacterium]